ncbi:hypothetical protein [Pseudotabrizicola algicola]|uniref:Uncharacterized protein n=1 Tax=Pseudotabrizicola algicola TaxID=2709381 RepID=A0A6B3RK48_9RHOB|nr:hypothetical protein [Pseudotabrizicola algicola]NEX45606.1 hypothetical protein [Pseudotabrizicola algicola]
MFTRSAIFRGRIKPGMEDEFYAAVEQFLVPAWSQMLHAQAVRVYRPVAAEAALGDVFLVQEIDYPSREAIDEALASPRRVVAMQALERVRPLYDGRHHHVIYRRLGPGQ